MQPENIGLDDSFFRLGGDSIAAVQLMGMAREAELSLTVADVFQRPTLAQLASSSKGSTSAQTQTKIECNPFSLLSIANPEDFVRDTVAPKILTDASNIADVLPTTGF